ncbi:MAG TPA: nucleoside-diphosphate sugar epimerase/dehydratase [Acidimicrobiales bacterium]|nr:nucleoside-diphosphate sugar epimerase/dehydratase [Acidimicrobiales bacterium]
MDSAMKWQLLGRWRTPVQVTVDALAWIVGLTFATLSRYDFGVSHVNFRHLGLFVVLAVLVQVVAGLACGLYTGRSRFGSFDEVLGLVRAVGITTAVLFAFDLWALPVRLVPLSAPLAGGMTALVLLGGTRYVWRLVLEARRRPTGEDCERLVVFGAGEGGAQVITSMLRDPASPYLPVALLDDDPAKRKLRIMGVPVVGNRYDLAAAAATHRATAILVAIPSADTALIGDLTDLATEAGLGVKVLPAVRELFGGDVGIADIRDFTAADLLGRHQIETDVAAIAGYLTGRRVLVTGAGGSIGSELCRQIYRFGPSELIMVDRDESALHGVQLLLEGRAPLDSPDLVLLDIRDRPGVERLFAARRPEVVFHAAALKHLTLLERFPREAFRSNVVATLDLLQVAAASGVERFVNISTDKAADPSSVLGFSKRIAERITAHMAEHSTATYLSVRFGNVLGSRGSMLTTFRAQLDSGGPLTVTDPDVTRYFMTIEEAVELVIQAGAIGQGGEALVLDMGEPVRIADLARRLAGLAKRPVDVVFIGLRPGEKLHETLLGAGEVDARPSHPLISQVRVPSLHPDRVREIEPEIDGFAAAMRSLCDHEHQPLRHQTQ